MPDPAGTSSIGDIHNTLKASLGIRRKDSLDEDVAAASKRVLLHKIEFCPASAPYSIQRDALKSKYILLNSLSLKADATTTSLVKGQKQNQQGITSASQMDNETLPVPRVVLYPEEKVKMDWTRMVRIGAGLVNMGNTCFFNSTLQCLTYTAPLVNYCHTSHHRDKCRKNGFCMMCEVTSHIRTSLECGGRSIKPHSMLQKLRCIAKHMKWGRQEDAHEFLRFLVDNLQQSCLNGENKNLDKLSKDTNVINQIFGGYLRSQVICSRCQGKSNTYDPFMDLSLDLKGVNTAEDALQKFVKADTLENENAYKCPRCKTKVRAIKRFSIQKAPNVLTLQLNRFQFNGHFSGKINRFIKFPEKINIRNYMSQKQGDPILYHLYGIVVHSGHSSEHGHYYSYVKSPSKTWYCMNDSYVHQVNSNTVLSADAYVLFYARANKSTSSSTPQQSQNNMQKVSTPVKGPFSSPMTSGQANQEKSHHLVNGIHGKATSEVGTPLKRQQQPSTPSSSSSTSKIVPHGTSASMLPGSHSKISFPILTPQQKKIKQLQDDKDDSKHVVLKINHGNSTTMEKLTDGTAKMVNGLNGKNASAQFKPSGLVPYYSDSDSEPDNNVQTESNSTQCVKAQNSVSPQKKDSSQTFSGSQKKPSCDFAMRMSPESISSIPLPSGDRSCDIRKPGHNNSIVSPTNPKLSQPRDFHNNGSKSAKKDLTSPSCQQSPSKNIQNGGDNKPSKFNGNHSEWSPTPKAILNGSGDGAAAPSTPAGKGVALDLPMVLSASPSVKLKNSSGNWTVYPQDSAPSPRGSCSSINSVGSSTTEWIVEAKGSTNGFGAKHNKQKPFNFSRSSSLSDIKSSAIKGFGDLNTQNESNGLKIPLSKNNSDYQKDERIPLEVVSRTPMDISDKQPILFSPISSLASDSSSVKKSKKHKKKNKHKEREREEENSSQNEISSKKKKKHTKMDNIKKKYRGSDSSDSDSSNRKSHKSKKDSDDSDDDSNEKRGKAKKLKQKNGPDSDISYSKKHRSNVRNDSESEDDSYEKKRKQKKLKKTRYDSSDSDSSSRQRNKTSSSKKPTDDYEWVEKNVESPAVKGSSSAKSKASIQSWNHHIQDDLAIKKDSVHKVKAHWDGSRVPKVAHNLNGSSLTMGNVLSWDGKKNHVDKELEQDKKHKKRLWADDYNEDIDSGKVKKVKTHREDYDYGNHNAFQSYQGSKDSYNKSQSPWSQNNSYPQDRQGNNSRPNNHSKNWRYGDHKQGGGGHFKAY